MEKYPVKSVQALSGVRYSYSKGADVPKVSVIMPCYNVEKYVGEAIESILNQTFTDFEFIIINDGSTDDTSKIVRQYAKQDNRIKFIDNKKNRGFIATSNQCLDVATGEYVAKMDSDDISLPERLAKQVDFLDSHPEYGMVGCMYKKFGMSNDIRHLPEKCLLLDFLYGCQTTIVMFRRSIVEQHNLRYDSDYFACEDYDFYSRFVRYAPIANLQQVLYMYRWHGDNVSILRKQIQQKNTERVRQNILKGVFANEELRQKIGDVTREINQRFWLFGLLPIMRRKQYALIKTKYYLFDKIPLFKIQDGKVYLFELIRIGGIR